MLSAVVLTKNESKNIKKCLTSLKFCSEIIVVDDNSSDDTVKVAKEFGAKVFLHSLKADFARQRNWALKKVKTPWALFVDADEVVARSLAIEIEDSISDPLADGFFIRRIDFIWNRKFRFGENKDFSLLRLAKVKKGRWNGKVHEVWEISGTIDRLKNPIYHYPHPTLSSFIDHINFFSTIRAGELNKMGKRGNLFQLLVFPPAKFLQNYVFKFGFLDGFAGFVTASVMSIYTFLVRAKMAFRNRKI